MKGVKLLAICCECGLVEHVPFDENKISSRELYQELGWLISLVEKTPPVFGLVCGLCAPKVYTPEMLAVARAQMGVS